jgi:hypothetical protein
MISKIKPLLLSLPLALLTATPASSINIVTYNLTGAAGNQASQAPASAATNITGINITRGAGLGTSAAVNAFSSNGFENTASGNGSNEYIELGFIVASGFKVDLNNLQISTRSSGNGPGTIGLYYSGDGYSTALTTITQPNTNTVQSTIDLTSLTNLTGNVTFRFYEVGNTSAGGGGTTTSGGTFRLNNNTTAGDIRFTGDVTAVPVPFGFAPDFGLVVVGAWVSRKWIVKRIQELKK